MVASCFEVNVDIFECISYGVCVLTDVRGFLRQRSLLRNRVWRGGETRVRAI